MPRTPTKASLGEQLRSVRGETPLRELERRSGINTGYLSQLEQGKISHPSPSVLRRVAEAYGVRFEDVLVWAGYAPAGQTGVSPNQAVALSTVSALGEPSNEELETLKAIVELLQRNRQATHVGAADLLLDSEAQREIRGFVRALLQEADAVGKRPTPLADIQLAAHLVRAGELTLEPKDREALLTRFGGWVDVAWRRLLGTVDFRSQAIWVKPDLHPMKERFVISHEIGHAILPAHKDAFAYVDDFTRLPPYARDVFEREANQAAVEILFQVGQLAHEVDSSPVTLSRICDLSLSFGASIVATARHAVETTRHCCAVAIAHHGNQRLGPTHLYTSDSFESRFRWRSGQPPKATLREALRHAYIAPTALWMIPDGHGTAREVRVEHLDTGFAAIVLLSFEGGGVRRLLSRAPVAASIGG